MMEKGQVSTRILAIAVIVTAIVASLGTYFAVPPKAVKKPVKKKLIVFNKNPEGTPGQKAMDAVVEDFKEAYPNIDVIVEHKPHEEFKIKIRSWLPMKRPPADVFSWFTGERLKFFVDKGLVLPVDDVWDKIRKYYLPPAESTIKFHGHDYGVTIDTHPWCVFYRKSIFKDLGLSIPKNWDELLSTYETLKKNGYAPVCIGSKYRWTIAGWFDAINLAQNGLDFHMKLMRGEVPYTDDRVRETMKKLREVFPYYLKGHSVMSWREALQSMIKKESATYLMGMFLIINIPKKIRDDFGVFPFPTINPDIPFYVDAPTDGLIIAKNAVNKETAKKFLEFFAKMEGKKKYAATGEYMTYLKPKYIEYKGLVKKSASILEKAKGVAQFYDRDTTPPMADKGLDAMVKFAQNPEKLDSILQEMERARKEIFE